MINTIHIGKRIKLIDGKETPIFIVPAFSLEQKDNPEPKKIPHPMGKDYMIFYTIEEAQNAVEHSGFAYTLPDGGKHTVEKQIYHTSYDDLILESLLQLANDISPTVAASAVFALGEIGHSHALELLINKMGEDNEIIRTNAIDAVAKYEIRAISMLISALEDENWVKRNSAVICLGKLADNINIDIQKMIVPLFKRLEDKNSIVKSSTALTLGKVYKNIKKQQQK